MVGQGVTRSKGVRPRRKATPAVPGVLRLMLGQAPLNFHADRRARPRPAADRLGGRNRESDSR
jgi:hypothetical protein